MSYGLSARTQNQMELLEPIITLSLPNITLRLIWNLEHLQQVVAYSHLVDVNAVAGVKSCNILRQQVYKRKSRGLHTLTAMFMLEF